MTRIHQKILLTLLVLLFTIAADAQKKGATISYRIQPVSTADRTELHISLSFTTDSDTAVIIPLPQDCYGTMDYYRFIRSFKAVNGCMLQTTGKPEERKVVPNSKKTIAVEYIISADPVELDGVAFGVNTSAQHFHFGGCQWMLPIGNTETTYRYEIKITDVPKGWQLYSSLSNNPENMVVESSYDALVSSAIGGGSQSFQEQIINGKPVRVFIAGNFEVPADSIFQSVFKIVNLQRQWFKDDDFPFYTVTVMQRSGIIAGTCIANSFVCFVKPEIKAAELNVLISHEMFHTWLPGKINIQLQKGESDLLYEWFTEGFAEYFARLILAEAGCMSEETFISLVNRDIINTADNPFHSFSYKELVAAKGGGAALKKLSYYRGALIAVLWEQQLREQGNSNTLKDFILALYAMARTKNGTVAAADFFTVGSSFGLKVKEDMEHYILNGQPIVLPEYLQGAGYVQKETAVPSFDPSFSLKETFTKRKISGVVENGNAWNAGLRNDMEFISIRNSNRFGNGWSPDEPMVVTAKEKAVEKRIIFYPRGKEMKLKLYYKVQ